MKNIKVTTSFPNWPLIRQTPKAKGIWKNYKFHINENLKKCDYWVILEGLSKIESTICPKNNTLFISFEPSCIKKYSQKFINQFNKIITSHNYLTHKNIIYSQQGINWFIGVKRKKNNKIITNLTYDKLKKIRYTKNKLLSVVISNKNKTPIQRSRISFIKYLKKHLKNDLDVFGEGFNWIEDKLDALKEYKYTIVIENCNTDDYWSEKLADAYLTECFPFYFGCNNIEKYFDKNSFVKINIYNKKESLKIIKKTIHEKKYEKYSSLLKRCKLKILDEYNIFEIIYKIIKKSNFKYYSKIEIKPENFFIQRNIFSKIYRKLKLLILEKLKQNKI